MLHRKNWSSSKFWFQDVVTGNEHICTIVIKKTRPIRFLTLLVCISCLHEPLPFMIWLQNNPQYVSRMQVSSILKLATITNWRLKPVKLELDSWLSMVHTFCTTFSPHSSTSKYVNDPWFLYALFSFAGRRLRITPKVCESSSSRYSDLDGICMFNLECQEHSGTVIGACVDRFLFGACCHIADPVKRKEILSGANSTSPGEISTSALLSPLSPGSPNVTRVASGGKPTPSSRPTDVPSFAPHPHENHSTRFPVI